MNPTVLIVDDEKDIVLMARLLLEDAGYSVLEAFSGKESLALIEENTPDAVLLDLSMPGMSGWEVLHQLKTERKFEKFPVIVISAHSDHTTADECIGLGATAYLKKPFRKASLLRAVEAALSQ